MRKVVARRRQDVHGNTPGSRRPITSERLDVCPHYSTATLSLPPLDLPVDMLTPKRGISMSLLSELAARIVRADSIAFVWVGLVRQPSFECGIRRAAQTRSTRMRRRLRKDESTRDQEV